MTAKQAKNPIKTTQTSFLLLRTLVESEGATLSELNKTINLTKGAIYNHLATLIDLNIVTKRADTYYVSLQTFQFGEGARNSVGDLRTARKKICELASTTGEFTSLIVVENENALVFDTAIGHLSEFDWMSLGERLPLHSTAAGKIVLSRLPHGRFKELYRPTTKNSHDDVVYERLLEEIKTIKGQGLAFNRGEFRDRQYSVAAPVINSSGSLVCIVNITGPKERLSGKALQQDVAGLVVSATTEIQRQMVP